MSSKTWILLLGLAAASFLWFFAITSYEVWTYWRLDSHAPADVRSWRVKELGSSKFTLSAAYSFQAAGKRYESKDDLKEPVYINRFAAEDDMKKFRGMSWSVWYNKGHPEISSLQKFFPFKHLIYTLMTAGILIFFVFQRLSFSRSK